MSRQGRGAHWGWPLSTSYRSVFSLSRRRSKCNGRCRQGNRGITRRVPSLGTIMVRPIRPMRRQAFFVCFVVCAATNYIVRARTTFRRRTVVTFVGERRPLCEERVFLSIPYHGRFFNLRTFLRLGNHFHNARDQVLTVRIIRRSTQRNVGRTNSCRRMTRIAIRRAGPMKRTLVPPLRVPYHLYDG